MSWPEDKFDLYRVYAATHPFGWDRSNLLNATLRQAVLAPHSKKLPSLDECMVIFRKPVKETPDDLIAQFDNLIAHQNIK